MIDDELLPILPFVVSVVVVFAPGIITRLQQINSGKIANSK